MSVDGLPLKSTGGDDGNPVKAISSAPKPPEVDRSAVVPPTPELSVSEVDINKLQPTTSAVLSDKIALSEGDHPDTSVSDLDASKKVLPSTKALIVASAEGVVLSHEDKSSEMKPASPGSSLPPDMALSAEETTAATTLALDGSDASKEAEDSKVDKASQGESLTGESIPGKSVLEVDTSSGCPCPQSLLRSSCLHCFRFWPRCT